MLSNLKNFRMNFYRCLISSKCFEETAICIHFTIFGLLNVRAKIPIHCSLAIKNSRTESLLFLFSRKINLYFHIHFISIPFVFFTIHVTSVKYTLISNYYKNRRRLKQTLESAQTRFAHTRVFLVELPYPPLPLHTHTPWM